MSKLQGALSGFASLLSDPTAGQVDSSRRALLASDLHDNTLVLGSLSFYDYLDPREGPNTGAIEGLHGVSPLDPGQPSSLSSG